MFDANISAFYISTSLGVWRVTAAGVQKLTSDEYGGKHYSWYTEDAYSQADGWSKLFWVTNVCLSPDKRYIIYRSNRDCYDNPAGYTSIWRVDLETGAEQRILECNAINSIDGFVTDNLAIIDARNLLDVSTGTITPLMLPELPNRNVAAAGFGYIACTSYSEKDADGLSSLYIFRVEPATGALTEVFTKRGYFSSFGFSPSGELAYVEYGTDPDQGVVTLMFFDFKEMTVRFLEDMLGNSYQELGGAVVRAIWLTEDAMLLNVSSVVDNKGVELTWLAEW
jgi:hypothetical protein